MNIILLSTVIQRKIGLLPRDLETNREIKCGGVKARAGHFSGKVEENIS